MNERNQISESQDNISRLNSEIKCEVDENIEITDFNIIDNYVSNNLSKNEVSTEKSTTILNKILPCPSTVVKWGTRTAFWGSILWFGPLPLITTMGLGYAAASGIIIHTGILEGITGMVWS